MPIEAYAFVYEIDGAKTEIFTAYLKEFSLQRPLQAKIVVIDNAGFNSTKNICAPDHIFLLRIPLSSPKLNPY